MKSFKLTSDHVDSRFLRLVDQESGEDLFKRLLVTCIRVEPIYAGGGETEVTLTCILPLDLLVQQIETLVADETYELIHSTDEIDRVIARLHERRAELTGETPLIEDL